MVPVVRRPLEASREPSVKMVLAAGPRDEVLTPPNVAAAFRFTPPVVCSAVGHPYLVFE